MLDSAFWAGFVPDIDSNVTVPTFDSCHGQDLHSTRFHCRRVRASICSSASRTAVGRSLKRQARVLAEAVRRASGFCGSCAIMPSEPSLAPAVLRRCTAALKNSHHCCTQAGLFDRLLPGSHEQHRLSTAERMLAGHCFADADACTGSLGRQ